MAYFELNELKSKTYKTTATMLSESTALTHWDIFLSHTKSDEDAILPVYQYLTVEARKTVYVDWICDPHLTRDAVTPATAARLRERMKQCGSMLFVVTANAGSSKWMPWELGYFDGLKPNFVAVFPLTRGGSDPLVGQEYVKLYPHVARPTSATQIGEAVVYGSANGTAVPLKQFLSSGAPPPKA